MCYEEIDESLKRGFRIFLGGRGGFINTYGECDGKTNRGRRLVMFFFCLIDDIRGLPYLGTLLTLVVPI